MLGQGGGDLGEADVAALVAQLGFAQFVTGPDFGAAQFPLHRGGGLRRVAWKIPQQYLETTQNRSISFDRFDTFRRCG